MVSYSAALIRSFPAQYRSSLLLQRDDLLEISKDFIKEVCH